MKNKDVLVFFSFSKHKTGYYNTLFNPLKAEEDKYGLTLHKGSLKDSIIEVVDNKLCFTEALTGRLLDTFSVVTFQLWLKAPQQALAAATYLKRKGVPSLGEEILQVTADTKIGELVRMSDQGLPLPRSFMSSRVTTLKVFRNNPPIKYPFIAKAADAFGGSMNFLVNDYTELKAALNAHKDQYFVLQEFIPNDCDYRVLIMGGEIKLVMKRARDIKSVSHLNNTSAGAVGSFVPVDSLSEEIRKDALKAAKTTLRSHFAGVDIIIDKNTGKHYILEVNEAPAIQTGEQPEVKVKAFMEYIAALAEKSGEKYV